jgi:hypothetical protein
MDIWSQELQQEIHSKVASINSAQPASTFRRGTFTHGINLDLGGGRFDNATELLAKQGVTNLIYDPYNRSLEHNQKVISLVRGGQCTTVTVNNVLNVIKEPELRDRVIRQAADAVAWHGTAYFLIYAGDKTGVSRVTIACKGEASVWQENRRAETYIAEIAKHFGVVSRSKNLLIATCPMKELVPFKEYRQILRQLPFGKRLPQAVYVYRMPLGDVLDTIIQRAASLCPSTPDHNILKLREDAYRLSFLRYPGFFEHPHPALQHSISLNLETGKWTEQDFSKSLSPPILHRKECFLPSEHPKHAEFAALTRAEEQAGLYAETSTIGRKDTWECLLASKNIKLRGHQLIKTTT